ncbi:Spike glycoprotein [Bienertia sinuspersici]
MLDVLNLTSSNDTFDRRVSAITLSSSPTIAMGQHVRRGEPIGGIVKMVHLKDFIDSKRRYLALVDREDDLPKSGTCLVVRPSLLRPDSPTKWKSNTVKFIGDSFFILGYWEWSEDIFSRYGDILELCSCPTTNTLHTIASELSFSLWDLYKLGSLPISGRIYDEALPHIHTLCAYTDKGNRRIPKACESLFAAYRQIVQRSESKKGVSAQQWVEFWCKRSILYSEPVKQKRYTNAPLKSTHNPSGKLANQPLEWSTSELDLFNSLGIEAEGRRETTYVVALLSCWLCVFVLPKNEDRLIRLGTFEVDVLMERGETFSLAIPVLASIYRGINILSRSPNPSYSGTSFPAHYFMPPVCAPCLSLDWHKLKTVKFHDWWTMVIIKDLRHNIDKLCSVVESYSNPKRVSPHDEARDAHRSANGHVSQHEDTSDNVCATSSKILHLTGAMDEVEGEDKSTSDVESKINFKHQRRRRSKKPRAADLEGEETDFGNAFDNIPIPLDIPTDLTKVGDIDFKIGASFNIDDAMIEEAIEPLNVLTNRTVPGKGKEIHSERNLVERENSASPTQTHHSVDGPSVFEISSKTLGIPLDAKGIPRSHLHGDAVPALSISTIRVTPASQGIFTPAIKIFGNEYLILFKITPIDKVSDRLREASQVLAVVEELKLVESSFYAALTKHKGLEEESVALKKKEDELLKELEEVHQRMDQVTNDLGDDRNSLTTLKATMQAMKRRVEELEAVSMCSTKEMELFEEQEMKLLEFQSSLDSSEWIM